MDLEKKPDNKKAGKGKSVKSAEVTSKEVVIEAAETKVSNKKTTPKKASAKKKVDNKKAGENPVESIRRISESEEKKLKREAEERIKKEKEEAELRALDIYRWQTLDYTLALRLVKRDMDALPHGAIRPLCSTHKLTYHTVIGLLNDTITFEAPKLVLDLLYVMEYEVKLTMEITPTGMGSRQYKEVYYFTLRKKGNG